MILADIPFAIEITETEGWGYAAADFRRLQRLDSKGCIVAVSGGKRIGLTTAISYGKVGWVGNVIVAPESRGQGIGAELIRRAVAHLRDEGAETVRLNAYLNRVRFYEDLGFKGEYENVRFAGTASGGSVAPVGYSPPVNLDRAISFDKRFFGASRTRLLSSLWNEFPDTFISLGGGKIRGYIVGQVSAGSCEIAPWVVDPSAPGAAKELWGMLEPRIGGVTVGFAAPAASRTALAAARWLRLKPVFRTLRMYCGRRAHGGRSEGIVALGGLDKG